MLAGMQLGRLEDLRISLGRAVAARLRAARAGAGAGA
jgi:hypothetical protein